MATIVIASIVFICIAFAGYNTYKSSKKGPGCSCGCSGCDKSNGCH